MLGQHSFQNANEVFEAVYAHIVMEMVCIGENHLARQILDEQKNILVPNWYQDLWAVLYEGRMPFTMAKKRDEEAMLKLDDPIVVNSRAMLSKLVKHKLLVLKPPSDKLIDLILLAKAKRLNFNLQRPVIV